MLATNANFDAFHELDQKTPIYLIHFEDATVDYCNLPPLNPTNTVKSYVKRISGLSQKVEPEEGRSSIGGVTLELLDFQTEITSLLATDSVYYHRKRTTIKAGYLGMAEVDMMSIFTGWVTGLQLSKDGLVYVFEITDPQKWMQRKAFRNASTDAPVIVSGNWVDIMLSILTSTGEGTNGYYDRYEEPNGLGIEQAAINIAHIEAVRNQWFPGDSCYVKYTITERTRAKDFFETEFFKVFNCYPVIDGQGRFDVRPFKPPLAAIETVQSFDEDNIIGIPEWNANLDAMINEIEFAYDFDHVTGKFENERYYIESTSVNSRGPGKRSLSIKSKGLHGEGEGVPARAESQIEQRKNKIFERWATPPALIKLRTFFSRWLSEAGDVVPVSHWLLPDIESGTRGLSESRMEIIDRTVDWNNGEVRFSLLNTGFAKSNNYMVLSPVMKVVTGTSGTAFSVSTADAAKWTAGWEADIYDAAGRQVATNITILTINTGTGAVTCDDIGSTPAEGWMVQFAAFDYLTDAQALYWTVKTTGALLIVP